MTSEAVMNKKGFQLLLNDEDLEHKAWPCPDRKLHPAHYRALAHA